MEEVIKNEIGRLETQIGQKFEELKKDRITVGEFKEFSEKVDAKVLELEKKLLETKRPVINTEPDAGAPEIKAFRKYLQAEPLGPEEKKVLAIGQGNTGGYIAPSGFYEEVVKYLVQASPIRKYARVVTASGPVINVPKITSRTGASWVAESAEISTETQPVFAQTQLTKQKMGNIQKVSWELIRDSKFNIDSLLAEIFAEDFAKAEGTAFVKGDGSNKPYGITHGTNGGTKVLTANANQCVPDDLIALVYSIPTRYVNDGILGMNRAMIQAVRGWKTETGVNNYVWEPDFQNGTPGKILGVPVVEIPDLDDTVAGGKNLAICGDLKTGFWIVDEGEMEVIVADQLYAPYGLVGYLAIKRLAAGVVNPNAVAFLQVKAA